MLSGLFRFPEYGLVAGGFRRKSFVLAILLVVMTFGGGDALGQTAPARAVTPAKNGIWFQVKAAIKPVPQPKGLGDGKAEPRASLSVQLRISSHADGSRYYGHPTQKFDFKLSDGSEKKLYWQDSACHPRRGLPKISVVAIDGTVERDGRSEEIKARPRQLGTRLPADEISPGSSLVRATAGERPALTFGASTKASKIDVLVKVYTVDCAL